MKTIRFLAAATLLCGLTACSLPQLAATATTAVLSPERVATLTSLCRRGESIVAIATSSVMPAEVKVPAEFVGAYCRQLLAGTVPPTTDSGTESWIERNLGIVAAALPR